MPYRIFCLVVFVIQTIITCVDFALAHKHLVTNQNDAAFADILAGISWGMTACWWLYLAITTPIE